MSCLLDLQDIFHLSKDGFNEASFSQQDFILEEDEAVLHVGAQVRDQVQPFLEKSFDEFLRNVPLVSNHFSTNILADFFYRLPVINVARRDATLTQVSLEITNQV